MTSRQQTAVRTSEKANGATPSAAPADPLPPDEAAPADPSAVLEALDLGEGDHPPDALALFYQRLSGDIVAICEKERRVLVGLLDSWREQRRMIAWCLRTIRDALREDGQYLTDWCRAVGADYDTVANLIEGLERWERTQHARPAIRGEQPANDDHDEPPDDDDDATPQPTPKPEPKPKLKPGAFKLTFTFAQHVEYNIVFDCLRRVKASGTASSDEAALRHVVNVFDERVGPMPPGGSTEEAA